MLTKTEKQILKSVIKLSNNGLKPVNYYEVSSDLNIHPNIVINAIPNLVKSELLKYVYQIDTNVPVAFMLTSYSQNLKEYKLLIIKKFLANNLIGILALIVAVIALFLPA